MSQGGEDIAEITVEDLYYGNERHPGIMCETAKDILLHGCPADYTEQTWLEMLIVKHTLFTAEQMQKEGDSLSGMTDTEPLSVIK